MNWICKHCGQSFPSRRKLQEHNKIEHNIGPRGKGQTAWNKGLTKENNEIMQQIAKHCSETLKGKPGHKHTEETKKKLSEIRKKQIAENDGIWWNSRSKCKRSYAEEWTKRLLENEFKRTDFVEEYKDVDVPTMTQFKPMVNEVEDSLEEESILPIFIKEK